LVACRLDRVEKPAPGQPTMNEQMHRQAERSRRDQEKANALMTKARALTPDQAKALLAKLKQNPEDGETYWTLARHYEHKVNIKDLNALRLWYIEHHPGGKTWTGNINPQLDRKSYERDKALWLAHLKRPGVTPEMYQRAADFLEGGDRALAEAALEAGRKAYPDDRRWPSLFGRHYAQALVGSGEPMTEYNVFRFVNAKEAHSPYAESVRARLAESTEASVLAHTARSLLTWGFQRPGRHNADLLQLAQTYAERAVSLEPNSTIANAIKRHVAEFEERLKAQELAQLSPADLAARSASDQLLVRLVRLHGEWMRNPDEAASQARELLNLAGRHQNDPRYGDAVFEGNIVLGKAVLRRGDRKASVSYLLAAAGAPVTGKIRAGQFDMNLPRALVDRGERRAVAEFLELMAPKTVRSKQLEQWATEIRKGINPDLIPTFSYPGCSQDPC